ncbi:glycosyltransferase [Paenibacillus assamensis]|uniref:glycosyltransferase n=1 Tax=Paenibacillus assamensis TaxID=311244 RepID=UPI0003FEEF64|nr:glycosyltransferase family 2 protein [Paenibacillus assamensis]
MEIIFWAITVVVTAQMLFVIWNLRHLPRLMVFEAGRQWLDENDAALDNRPKLSVLIPARNEVDRIADCIAGVLADPSPHIEVLVLDDRSEDGTAELVRQAGDGDPRLQLITGEEPPPDWMGKSYACWQLAQRAQGQWWLFLDADVRVGPNGLAVLLNAALEQGNGLITGFPKQITETWLEKLIVPLMNFVIACHLPIKLVRDSHDPRFVAAHGACMLIHKDSYWSFGGHAAFRAHLVDDMQMAKAVKMANQPVALVNICDHLSMRMYTDAHSVWNGYKKNIYAGVGRNPIVLFGMLVFYMFMYVIPALTVFVSIGCYAIVGVNGLATDLFVLSLVSWLIGLLIKTIIDWRYLLSWGHALWLPVSILLLISIAIASWWASKDGRGYTWKGRTYQ